MTREELEELKGLAASMGLYDDKNPCKRAMILGKAIKALEQGDVLDKIKRDIFNACSDNYHMPVYKLDCDKIFEIIDKYRAEQGVSNADSD